MKCCRCRVEKSFPQEFTGKRVCKQCAGDAGPYFKRKAREREWLALPEHERTKIKAQKAEASALKSALKRYGLTPSEYEALKEQQGGVCAICKNPNTNGRRLAVDHDHETGEVRGLLCVNCNLGLGNFQDNQRFLEQAVNYLRRADDRR